jgi:hypothetical protein
VCFWHCAFAYLFSVSISTIADAGKTESHSLSLVHYRINFRSQLSHLDEISNLLVVIVSCHLSLRVLYEGKTFTYLFRFT